MTPLIWNFGSNCPNCLTLSSPISHIQSFYQFLLLLSPSNNSCTCKRINVPIRHLLICRVEMMGEPDSDAKTHPQRLSDPLRQYTPPTPLPSLLYSTSLHNILCIQMCQFLSSYCIYLLLSTFLSPVVVLLTHLIQVAI